MTIPVCGPELTDEMVTRTEAWLKRPLPAEYVAFLRANGNGGVLVPSVAVPVPTIDEFCYVPVNILLGIDHPGSYANLRETMDNAFLRPRNALPIATFNSNEFVLMLDGPKAGEVHHLDTDQGWDEEALETEFVAANLDAFVTLIQEGLTDDELTARLGMTFTQRER